MTPIDRAFLRGHSTLVRVLSDRGYPVGLAVRIACTPPFAITTSNDDAGARPGRELARSIEMNVGKVVRLVAAEIGVPR